MVQTDRLRLCRPRPAYLVAQLRVFADVDVLRHLSPDVLGRVVRSHVRKFDCLLVHPGMLEEVLLDLLLLTGNV